MKKSAAVPSGAAEKRGLREFIDCWLLLAPSDDVKPPRPFFRFPERKRRPLSKNDRRRSLELLPRQRVGTRPARPSPITLVPGSVPTQSVPSGSSASPAVEPPLKAKR